MKQKPNENKDALSARDLLGRLKQSFTDTDAPAKTPAANASQTEDDLDIAALLRQYLPADGEDAPASAPEEDVPADEGKHFAALIDALGLEEDGEDPAEDPMKAFAEPEVEPAPTSAPSGVRKYVYHFRPSARNGHTVKLQETVPVVETEPVAQPTTDAYFAGSARPDFVVDDEPVIPDAAAFADLIPPIGETEVTESAEAVAPVLPETEAISEDIEAEPVAPIEVAEELEVEEEAETTEPAETEAPALDDTDINLMIALGYEEELAKTVGIDRVSEIEQQLNAESSGEDARESAAFRGYEYTEKAQAKEIMQNYRTEYSGVLTRLIGTLILTVALFLYENVSIFGIALPGMLNMAAYPVSHTLISLQLLVLAGALSWRQLFDGLRGAVTLKPTPASLSSVAVAVAVLYDVLIAIIAPETAFSLYNFPAALCLCLLCLCDLMDLKREIYSFTILADRGEKFGARAKLEPSQNPDEDNLCLDIRRAAFIENYFARTGRKPAANTRLNYVLLPVVALAIALAIVSFSTGKAGVDALSIFVLTVLFCMPISTLIACSYPLFRAAQLAYEQDTAIIGEASVEEYSDANAVSFADRDVFPSIQVRLRSIKLYGNARPDLVLFAASSVFSKLDGPLADVLELATKEFDRAETVELGRITENGIEATVDGTPVLVGRAEFFEDYNIYPLYDAEDNTNAAGGARILYIAMNGVLSAKLYVQYDMDADFIFTLREMGREHMAARIRTYDPNIDDELILSKLHGKRFDVHVEKLLTPPEEPDTLETLDSGLVSRASAKSLIHAAAICSRLGHVERTGGLIRSIALGVSLLIMLFLTLLSSTVGISSIYVALYQIFWMIPVIIFTRLSVK